MECQDFNMMNKAGIYMIKNYVTGKCYIGSTKKFSGRRSEHLNSLIKNKHHSIKLQRAYNKYGSDNFEFIIIEYVTDLEQILVKEQWWLDNYKPEYNISPTASSPAGIKRDSDYIAKLKLRKCSIETRELMSLKRTEYWSNIIYRTTKNKGRTAIEIYGIEEAERRAKRSSETHTGKIPWNKGVKFNKIICPHCSAKASPGNIKRWHFDNCKLKNNAII